MTSRVYWRGALVDDRLAAQMDQVARLVPAGTVLRPTQGSWSGGVSASAGTHDGGGAIDMAGQDSGMTSSMRAAIRDAMRQVGIAAWVRDPSQSNWPYHVHGISVQPGGKYDRGCLSSGAASQVVDYYDGRNGLASGAPDDGPRTWVGVTWETYQPPQPPKDWFDMATDDDLRRIIDERLDHYLPRLAQTLRSGKPNATNPGGGDFTYVDNIGIDGMTQRALYALRNGQPNTTNNKPSVLVDGKGLDGLIRENGHS